MTIFYVNVCKCVKYFDPIIVRKFVLVYVTF